MRATAHTIAVRERPTVAVVLGEDDTVAAAIDEAVRRDARLAVITAPGVSPVRVDRVVRRSRSCAPGLDVVVVRDRACRVTSCARPPVELVVGPRDVDPDLLRTSRSEILVMPPSPSPTGPVVLGMAPWTGTGAVRAAIREAERRDAPLEVVRAWRDPGIDPGVVHPDVLRHWDEIDARLHSDARERLDALRHTAGTDDTLVVRDSGPEALALFARTACLLVVGHRGDAEPDTVLALACGVRCPMLIVPDAGVPLARC